LYGWRLGERGYRALKPNEHGWLWSEELGVWLGEWQGEYERVDAVWLRFYTSDGRLTPTGEEAQAEARRAAEARAVQEAEARREAEAELARLRAELARLRGEAG
jgi:hypothetical protein